MKSNSLQKVTVYWKDDWYHLMDKDGNFLQQGSTLGASTAFGSISAAIGRSNRIGIEEVAAKFDLQIEETWVEFLRSVAKPLLFVLFAMFMLFGTLLAVLLFRLEHPTTEHFIAVVLMFTLGIVAGLGEVILNRTDK